MHGTEVEHTPRLVYFLCKRQGLPDTAGIPVPAICLDSFLVAAPKFLLVKLQCLLFRPFGRVGHVALVRLFHAIHAAGRPPADEHFAEEAAPILVLQAVDGKYLLAIHLGQTKNLSDFVKAVLNSTRVITSVWEKTTLFSL